MNNKKNSSQHAKKFVYLTALTFSTLAEKYLGIGNISVYVCSIIYKQFSQD
jgi:hypothetical protein